MICLYLKYKINTSNSYTIQCKHKTVFYYCRSVINWVSSKFTFKINQSNTEANFKLTRGFDWTTKSELNSAGLFCMYRKLYWKNIYKLLLPGALHAIRLVILLYIIFRLLLILRLLINYNVGLVLNNITSIRKGFIFF